MPESHAQWGKIYASTYTSWGEVVTSLAEKYETSDQETDDALAAFNWLTDSALTKEQRATCAIWFVQDESVMRVRSPE